HPVDARVGPELDGNGLATKVGRAERRRIQPCGCTVERGQVAFRRKRGLEQHVRLRFGPGQANAGGRKGDGAGAEELPPILAHAGTRTDSACLIDALRASIAGPDVAYTSRRLLRAFKG